MVLQAVSRGVFEGKRFQFQGLLIDAARVGFPEMFSRAEKRRAVVLPVPDHLVQVALSNRRVEREHLRPLVNHRLVTHKGPPDNPDKFKLCQKCDAEYPLLREHWLMRRTRKGEYTWGHPCRQCAAAIKRDNRARNGYPKPQEKIPNHRRRYLQRRGRARRKRRTNEELWLELLRDPAKMTLLLWSLVTIKHYRSLKKRKSCRESYWRHHEQRLAEMKTYRAQSKIALPSSPNVA